MFYNNGMDGLNIIDQKAPAYRIDGKTKHFLEHFFYLMGVTHVNSHIVYMTPGDNILLLNFKIVVTKALIGRYNNRNRSFFTTQLSK